MPGTLAAEQVWSASTDLIEALSRIGASPYDLDTFRSTSIYKCATVDRNGHEVSVSRRSAVRAEKDGLRRVVFATRQRGLSRAPEVESRSCRLGRSRFDVNSGFLAFELILDHELRIGEHAVVDFDIAFPPGNASTESALLIRAPIRLFTMEVAFCAEALPISCSRYYRPRASAPAHEVVELHIGPSHTVQNVTLDAKPGIYGMRWQWNDCLGGA
ncbi:hypothetical protein [Streptomyces sp. NPDC003023]|uniref:hypothetical protein n=1 Tax=Streptomyces sp. NPDC003023 TaxID=3364675 RepID=UPI0036ABC416